MNIVFQIALIQRRFYSLKSAPNIGIMELTAGAKLVILPPVAMTELRTSYAAGVILAALLLATNGLAGVSTQVAPILGPAPRAPLDVSGLPGGGPRKLDLTAGFSVNGN